MRLKAASIFACAHFNHLDPSLLFLCGMRVHPTSVLFVSRSPTDRAIEEDDIRESIFRYRIEGAKGNGPFFLSINGEDPSETFMARFAISNKIAVKKASGSYFKEQPSPGWLRDRSTDKEAIYFSVGSISWMSLDRVEVRGGMYCGGRCADAGIYRLRKKKDRWVVDQYEVQMVS